MWGVSKSGTLPDVVTKVHQRVDCHTARKEITMAENQGLATFDVKNAMSAQGTAAYSSLKAGTLKEKAKLYNAMSNPTHKVGDYINRSIRVKDVYVEVIELTDEETCELVNAPRVVLIDVDGETYQAVSKGMFSALSRAIKVFGEPTWDDGLPIIIRQISLGKNQMLTFDVDYDAI